MKPIDLNADIEDAAQQHLLSLITSANIACGGHAGDPAMMRLTLQQCRTQGVAAGAHPSYPDRANFGRTPLDLSPADLAATVAQQVQALADIAEDLVIALTHVKPHGALYNAAARDAGIARAIATGLRAHPHLILYGLRGSLMLDVFQQAGFRIAAEVFADRAYQPDGSLRPRHLPGALITDPQQAARNALALLSSGGVDTICLHSDTPGALAIASAVREALTAAGYLLGPL